MFRFGSLGFARLSCVVLSLILSRGNMTTFKRKLTANLVLLIAMIVFVIGGYYLHYKPIMVSNSLFTTFMASQTTSTFPKMQGNFQELLDYRTFGLSVTRQLMLTLANNSLITGAVQNEGGGNFILLTASEVEKQVKVNPGNLEVLVRAVTLFTNMAILDSSFIDKAQFYIDKAHGITPGHPMVKQASSTVKHLRKGEQ